MKKLFLVLAAAFAMAACQTDINEVGVVADGVAAVEFEVGAPQMRSYSDGSSATVLQYAVYDANGDILPELKGSQEIHGSTTVSLELAKNKTYSVIFWAAAPNAPYDVDFENKKVEVTYGGLCNDESRDAFYAYLPFEVTGAATLSVELRRPFAQVNVGTSDLEAAENSGFNPSSSALVVKNVYSTLNLVDGTASDNVAEVTFAAATVPTGETFPVDGNAYMAMSYVLVGKDKGSYDVTYTITAEDNTVINNTIGAVPMQANYRTNIYGKLLTSSTDINVEIDPEYEGENNKEVNINTTDYYITATYEAFSSTNFYVYFGNVTESSNKLVSVDYGDGTFGVDPWHTYSAAGDYNVKLYYEKPITEISQSAFSTTTIKSIVIPNDVVRIGQSAFFYSNLTSISFESESKLTTIEDAAFTNCKNLKSIYLPASVTEIGDCVFGGCYSLESIKGGSNDFYTYNGLFYKKLGNGYHDNHVIAYAVALNQEDLSIAAYYNIGWGAFFGCKYLKRLDIFIDKIYPSNFVNCEQLEYIQLYHTKYIENDIVKDCPKLKEIDLRLAREIGENCFINNESLTSINLGCEELKVINKIGTNNASLNILWIPSGVESITDSFNSCAALENIYCKATTPPVLVNSFDAIPSTAKIYVPYILYNEYKVAEGWNQHVDKLVAYDFENNAPAASVLQIGDYIRFNNGSCGVVFHVGDVVKVVSEQGWYSPEWSTEQVATGATDEDNGANNMAIIKSIEGWGEKYPAFKYCSDYGEGWYLPAKNELREIYENKDIINAALGWTSLCDESYWSSTENSDSNAYEFSFSAGYDIYVTKKYIYNHTCAVIAF